METLSPFVSTVKDKRMVRKTQAGDSGESTSLVEMSGRMAGFSNRLPVSVSNHKAILFSIQFHWMLQTGYQL